ncbi:MAG: hypothetical protein EBU66_15580, partial [Bacteroidetes bacterium]|nr:hypothetical protein [Bacteroidota bacterium]
MSSPRKIRKRFENLPSEIKEEVLKKIPLKDLIDIFYDITKEINKTTSEDKNKLILEAQFYLR